MPQRVKFASFNKVDMNSTKKIHNLVTRSSSHTTRHVLVNDLILPARIGIHKHEKERPQRVRVNLDISVAENGPIEKDHISEVLNYEEIVEAVEVLLSGDHINLVETLAEKISVLCLSYERVDAVIVRVEKLDVFKQAASVGVEINRIRQL